MWVCKESWYCTLQSSDTLGSRFGVPLPMMATARSLCWWSIAEKKGHVTVWIGVF